MHPESGGRHPTALLGRRSAMVAVATLAVAMLAATQARAEITGSVATAKVSRSTGEVTVAGEFVCQPTPESVYGFPLGDGCAVGEAGWPSLEVVLHPVLFPNSPFEACSNGTDLRPGGETEVIARYVQFSSPRPEPGATTFPFRTTATPIAEWGFPLAVCLESAESHVYIPADCLPGFKPSVRRELCAPESETDFHVAATARVMSFGRRIYFKAGSQVMPPRIHASVGYARGLTDWQGWGRRRTHAEGTVYYRVCRPNCASGYNQGIRGEVVLSRVRRCDRQLRYLKLRFVYSGVPKRDLVEKFNCRGRTTYRHTGS